VRAKTALTEKLLNFMKKVMNFCLGLFGFRLVVEMQKSGGAGEYINITLEPSKNLLVKLIIVIGTFLLNIFKRLINLILRPIPFLSPLSIYECTVKSFTIKQVWEDKGHELSPSQKTQQESCNRAIFDDLGYCKYVNNETNNELPMHKRALIAPTDCAKNFKCEEKDGQCVEKSNKDKCNSVPESTVDGGCLWRDVEDYEEEEMELLQAKYAHHIRYHMQEVVQVPEIALMPPLQLLQFFKQRRAHAQTEAHRRGETFTMLQQDDLLGPDKETVQRKVFEANAKLRPEEGEYDEEEEAAYLPHQIAMDFDEACRVSKRIIRKSGLKRFKELTGLKHPLRCTKTLAQRQKYLQTGIKPWPLGEKARQQMVEYVRARVHKKLAPEILSYQEEEGQRRKGVVTNLVEESQRLERVRIAKEQRSDEEALLQAQNSFLEQEKLELQHTEAEMVDALANRVSEIWREIEEEPEKFCKDHDIDPKHPVWHPPSEDAPEAVLLAGKLGRMRACFDATRAALSADTPAVQAKRQQLCADNKHGQEISKIVDGHRSRTQQRRQRMEAFTVMQKEHRGKCSYEREEGKPLWNSSRKRNAACKAMKAHRDAYTSHLHGNTRRLAKSASKAIRNAQKKLTRAKEGVRGRKLLADTLQKGWLSDGLKKIGEALIRWLEEIWNKVWEALKKLANAIVEALRVFWRLFLKAMKAMWEAIKKIAKAVFDAIMKALKWMWEQLKKFWAAFMKLLPKFDYLEFSDIYIRCLTDPKNCDKTAAKRVKIAICFSNGFGQLCLGPAVIPTLKEIAVWFVKQIRTAIENWFRSMFGFAKESVAEPGEVQKKKEAMTFSRPDKPKQKTQKGETYPVDPAKYKYATKSDGEADVPNGLAVKESSISAPTQTHDASVLKDGKLATTADAQPKPELIKQYKDLIERKEESVKSDEKSIQRLKTDKGFKNKDGGQQVKRQLEDMDKRLKAKKASLAATKQKLVDYQAGKPPKYDKLMDPDMPYKSKSRADAERQEARAVQQSKLDEKLAAGNAAREARNAEKDKKLAARVAAADARVARSKKRKHAKSGSAAQASSRFKSSRERTHAMALYQKVSPEELDLDRRAAASLAVQQRVAYEGCGHGAFHPEAPRCMDHPEMPFYYFKTLHQRALHRSGNQRVHGPGDEAFIQTTVTSPFNGKGGETHEEAEGKILKNHHTWRTYMEGKYQTTVFQVTDDQEAPEELLYTRPLKSYPVAPFKRVPGKLPHPGWDYAHIQAKQHKAFEALHGHRKGHQYEMLHGLKVLSQQKPTFEAPDPEEEARIKAAPPTYWERLEEAKSKQPEEEIARMSSETVDHVDEALRQMGQGENFSDELITAVHHHGGTLDIGPHPKQAAERARLAKEGRGWSRMRPGKPMSLEERFRTHPQANLLQVPMSAHASMRIEAHDDAVDGVHPFRHLMQTDEPVLSDMFIRRHKAERP
jgi:hypothetical protein